MTETKGWYLFETPSETFYSPSIEGKRKAEAIPTGSTNEEIAELINNYSGWDIHNSLKLMFNYSHKESRNESVELPGGAYLYRESVGNRPDRLVKFDLRGDSYLPLGRTFSKVEQDIKGFLENEKVYRDNGLMYKLGILLYGPPGGGKSVLIRRILKEMVPDDAITIFIEGSFPDDELIVKIKETLADRLKVFVFEELASDLSDWHIGQLLTFLDGELSVDKSISLATTNYPEKLPENIVSRPSRFDKLYEFEAPKEKERALLFKHFLGVDISEEDIKLSSDLSIAAIKEVSLLVLVSKVKLSEAITLMKKRVEVCKKNFAKTKEFSMGFSGRYEVPGGDEF